MRKADAKPIPPAAVASQPPKTASLPATKTIRRVAGKPSSDVMPLPPRTAEEIAASQEILAALNAAVKRLQQENLDRAVLLAQQAARGRGPLVKHFAELGRRFGDTLNVSAKPVFRLVEGGAA